MVVDEIRKDLTKSKQAFDEWRDAQAQAHAVEGRFAAACERYFEIGDEPPSAELIANAWMARAEANEKLTVILVEMGIESRPGSGNPAARKS